MNDARRLGYGLVIAALAILWACRAAPPEGSEAPKAGVFSDVLAAVEAVNKTMAAPGERDADVPRGEWRLILEAQRQFTAPYTVSDYSAETDYYQPEETDTGAADLTRGDALDVILDAEWEEYRTLSLSVVSETADPELITTAEESLEDFYRDLPALMDAVPDSLRERVIHIVVLRYYNTILRAGVDPRLFADMRPR